MTATAAASRRVPILARVTPQAMVLLIIAAAAWLWTIDQALDMGNMPGTMGLGLPEFLVMWTLMMAAMMFVSAAPFASMYARTVQERRFPRLALFAAGYLAVWGATGFPAYGLAWLGGEAAGAAEWIGISLAAGIFLACGIYQLTHFKYACLAHCRSPLSHLLHAAALKGRLRDLRAGLEHGGYCLGCCWSLMVLMAAFGVMNLWAMVGLAAVIAAEKLAPRGEWFGRAVGAGSLALAAAVIFFPEIAPGLTSDPVTMDMSMSMDR